MLELACKELKGTIINMFKDIKENVHIMNE